LVNAKRLMTVPASGSHETCMGLSPVKGLFGLAGHLICDCCLGCADSSLFGAEKAFFVPSPAIRFPERSEGVKGPKR
jgi:hypothetical protein